MSAHKIMVVEDNHVTRRMVSKALQRNGHPVLEAPDGRTARELMRRERPRVVLQDLMLPDADGFTLVGELRRLAQGADVSILAFSGFVSELDEARVSSVGFDDIIAKPIAPSRLVPLIEAHLPLAVPSVGQFGAGRRIVVADDDPMQLKLATFRLARLGFDVEGVPDGHAALAAVRRRLPDAVISDVMMPELDGFGLAMAIRQDPGLRALPVLLVTSSYVEDADRELARRAGATTMIARTPDLIELLEALSRSLASSGEPIGLAAEALPELEREHGRRVLRQLERQVLLNTGLARRCSALASELVVLTGISEAVLGHRDVDAALDEALAECFDAGGIAFGALYLVEGDRLRMRPLGAGQPGEPADAQLASFFGHEPLLRDTLREGRTLLVPSGTLGPPLERELLERAQANALLVVPLQHVGVPLGGLLMVSRDRELDPTDWTSFARGVATQVCQVLTLARAFDDRARAEQRAVEHASLLDAMLVNAPDTVAHLELDGTIRFINRASGGVDPESLRGANLLEMRTGDHQCELRAAMTRLIATGEAQGFDASILREDGTMAWYSTRLGPVRTAGALSGAVLVARDVSDRKHTEMHLMVADRMASVGTLAAGVAHEINNPLAAVIANLDMAAQDVAELGARAELPADLLDELEDARSGAERVRQIVRDLKIFSRVEEERAGPVDVVHVLESTLRMAWNELRHRARLVKNFAPIPHAEANESRLGQVFLNLIINAVHAIPSGNYDGNRITISTSLDAEGRIVVAIADTGTGIPPAVQARLFTPFFTTKPVGVGTGLGLAISHRILSQLGGTITFDSEVGKGTEFRVTLPVAAAGAAPARGPRRPTEVPPRRSGKLLVVDDEAPVAHAIQRYLSNQHDVTAVSSGSAALQLLLEGTRYDVILCDLMMPQVTGMELHAQVLALDPAQAARMVFLTGGAFTASAREFLDATPNARLEKPFDLGQLRQLVNTMIE